MAGKGQLQRDAEGLDRHDRDGAHGRANAQVYEGVLLAVDGADLVDHDPGKDADKGRV